MKSRDNEALIVFTTVGSEEQAMQIARELVGRRLAACVNIVPGVKSVYRWEGKIWEDEERTLMIKSTRAAFETLREAIRSMHSYDLPEIVALPVEAGDAGYLDWIRGSVDPLGAAAPGGEAGTGKRPSGD